MKRANLIKIALVLALVALGLPLSRANAENNLEGINISRSDDSIMVNISTSTSCEYNAFLTEGKPERIVIDLSGVVNDLSQKQFSRLPLRSIMSIRTSQYKSLPEAVARVVLDIERPIDFRSYRNGNDIVIVLPAVKDETEFSSWQSSNPVQMATKPRTKPVEVVSKLEVKPVEVAVKPQNPPGETVKKPENKPVEVAAAVEVAKKPQTPPVETVKKPETIPVEVAAAKDEAVEQETDPVYQPAVDVNDDKDAITPTQIAVAPQGVPVDTAPKRKAVEYTAASDRDPFLPLIGTGKGKGDGLPSLENLKLVGILEDVNLNRALLEDGEGNGYILKPNDKIQSGYLVTVTDSKAIFQISEYGWTRTVALELEVPEIK
jgi:hypothetical protein